MPFEALYIPMILPAFVLVLFRVMGVMLVTPLFSSMSIPFQFKIALGVTISVVLFPMVLPTISADLSLAEAVVGVFGELAVGMVIGMGVQLVFVGAKVGGLLVSQQAGIALGQVFNPEVGGEETIMEQIFFILTAVIFFGVRGHHAVLQAMLDSFSAVPPLSFRLEHRFLELLVDLMQVALILALKVAGPALIALFLSSVAIGFLSRTVPQINVLMVGFSIKVVIAMLVVAASLGVAQRVVLDVFWEAIDGIRFAMGIQ